MATINNNTQEFKIVAILITCYLFRIATNNNKRIKNYLNFLNMTLQELALLNKEARDWGATQEDLAFLDKIENRNKENWMKLIERLKKENPDRKVKTRTVKFRI